MDHNEFRCALPFGTCPECKTAQTYVRELQSKGAGIALPPVEVGDEFILDDILDTEFLDG